jgi:maltooligosyltrehalose trehalohydrolase
MGADVLENGSTRFRVWAPRARDVAVEIAGAAGRTSAMSRGDAGMFEANVENAGHGTDYFFVLDGEKKRPDPCSRWQPHGVHGPSRVVAHETFVWSDQDFHGVDLSELVLYELHVGTFTKEGTFAAILPTLPYLADLGVTAIELMPVAQFPGDRNWGYDGVFPYATQASYGGPDGLKKLVDASHRHGVAVVLDVVYNHLGPEGNYLGDFGPYFTDRYSTPWGQALNFDGPGSDEVRRYFRDNALHWLTDFHVDALRLDAIHTIFDMSARHFLQETVAAFHERSRALGRRAHIIAESDLNDARVVQPQGKNGFDFDAQWSDDFHHAVVAVATGARHGYFEDFGAVADIAKAVAQGFVYDGQPSRHRGRRHGNSSAGEPGQKFVAFLQNHDQVANAWHGKRLARVASPGRQRAIAALLFAQPGPPMLFMGQEFGEVAPFDFFTSHSDSGLIDAVRRGRREEHRSMGLSDPPDPQDEATFLASKIDWTLVNRQGHQETLRLYRDLMALRRAHPALSNGRKDLVVVKWSEAPRWITVERGDEHGDGVVVLVNFDDEIEGVPFSRDAGSWELALGTHEVRYGGSPASVEPPARLEVVADTMVWISLPKESALVYVKNAPSKTQP